MLQINSQGEIIWKKSIRLQKGGLPIFNIKNLAVYTGGIDQSNNGYRFCLSKFDTSGNLIWQHSYDSSYGLASICIDSNHNFVFAGSKLINKQQWYFAVTKIGVDGNYILSRTINTPLNSNDFCSQIRYTHDNGYILVGNTDYSPIPSNDDNILAVKTDSLFNTSPIVSILNSSAILITNFKLHQNYPNPFNPVTIINYQCSMFSNVKLKVYDIIGKEVVTLVNESKNAGSYNVTFNANNLPSGIYFYKLLINENSIDTKRMALVK